ncbi:hypothetical protein HYY70_06415 [Candidatus Woesearchaeota archaeon]|nr:hypothetical protein [Candidatus Woesearchaeota archaeon]
MFSDIVIPNNNEAEFIEIAAKLGTKKLTFLYDFDEYNEGKAQEAIQNHKINAEIGFIVNQKNINRVSKASKLLIVKSSDNDRRFIESKKINLIYGFEEIHKKDYLHQRASGLNHTLCEIMNKNNVALGISYDSLLKANNHAKALLMGRIMQNIALCQKYTVKTFIASFSENPYELRAQHDLISLFKILGMNSKLSNSLTSLS